MKRRYLCLLLIITLVITLTACGDKSLIDTEKKENNSTESTDANTESENESMKDEVFSEDWGQEESRITEKDGVSSRAYIKFPELLGITEGSGKIAYQPDGSLVILDGQYMNGVADDGIKSDEIFPLYFEQTEKIMKKYMGFGFDNFKFEIVSKENVTINDYEMCKYTGIHTFTEGSKKHEMAFVAYATRLKGNNAAVYWMVLDETTDQSIGDVIESHADKMAQTLHE